METKAQGFGPHSINLTINGLGRGGSAKDAECWCWLRQDTLASRPHRSLYVHEGLAILHDQPPLPLPSILAWGDFDRGYKIW